MKIEYWRPIPGYEGYEVSNLGRVRSIDRWVKYSDGRLRLYKGRILKPVKRKDGYLQVNLSKDNRGKMFLVHRLVAMAFIPNPDNLPMINHKDENPGNNAASNLEWCDSSYNNSYGTLPERQSQKQLNNPIRSKKVYQYTLDGVLIHVWPSTKECGRNGFNQQHVSACCRGERKSHRGYRWSYTPLNFFD